MSTAHPLMQPHGFHGRFDMNKGVTGFLEVDTFTAASVETRIKRDPTFVETICGIGL
jgi:hypothetical protein